MTAHTRSFEDLALSAPAPSLVRVPQRARRRSNDASPEYWFVFAVCFAVFIAALICERVLPKQWRKISEQIGARTLLGEARTAAHRYTAIAFQG